MSEAGSLPLVAVTGANGQVGRALIERLRRGSFTTVALTRKQAEVRADHCVVGSLGSAAAQDALSQADSIVHLAGALRPGRGNSYRAAKIETAEAVVQAARHGRAKRVLMLSFVQAAEDSSNQYLQSKRVAERLLIATGKDTVVFRSTHIIGPPDSPGPTAEALKAIGDGAVIVFGDGRQVVAPVFLGDVVSSLVMAVQHGPPGVYDLAGPDVMTMNELVRLVNANRSVRIRHMPPWLARLLGSVLPTSSGALVDVLLRDCTGDGSAARAAFGVPPTSLSSIWEPCHATT